MRSIHIGGIAKWLRQRSAKLLIAGSNPATIFIGLIAQLAEQRFEDPCVSGSIPFQTIYTDMVERHTHWT